MSIALLDLWACFCLLFVSTPGFIHGLKQHEELPVYQILLRLYTVVGAFRTAPPHIRLSVFRAALADHRKKAANQSLYSAVCRAVSPAADQEHAVSSLVMVYPGVLLSAAVLLDRSGQLHPWEPKLFNIAGMFSVHTLHCSWRLTQLQLWPNWLVSFSILSLHLICFLVYF